jgi:hypothetical protein
MPTPRRIKVAIPQTPGERQDSPQGAAIDRRQRDLDDHRLGSGEPRAIALVVGARRVRTEMTGQLARDGEATHHPEGGEERRQDDEEGPRGS